MNIEQILFGIFQVAIVGFLGSLVVDFCDRKLPKMLGVKE